MSQDMRNAIDIYNSGTYLEKNPTWHIEDSPWKAKKIFDVLQHAKLPYNTICEIGCGAGEILIQLSKLLPPSTRFTGYEISSQAYNMALARQTEQVKFINEDMLDDQNTSFYDILMVIDVFEHVDDYIGFLKNCKRKASYKIFHIPLELTAMNMLSSTKLLSARNKFGHLHHFSKETAIDTLKYIGYEIVTATYTNHSTELVRSIKTRLMNIPRNCLSLISKDLSVRALGGCSLLVLAK